jgi:hypothetical protein
MVRVGVSSESWGASPRGRIKGWRCFSTPYFAAVHGKTVNNSAVNINEGERSEARTAVLPWRRGTKSERVIDEKIDR